MRIFRIADGRKDFFQWDSRQRLIIDNYIPLCNQVHFCNSSTSEALVVEVKEENGIRYCDVPNILLQEAGHNHDDRYYTEAEVDNKLNTKANSSHVHSTSDITGLEAYINEKIGVIASSLDEINGEVV